MALTKEEVVNVKKYLSNVFLNASNPDISGFGMHHGHVRIYESGKISEQKLQEIREKARDVLGRPLMKSELECVHTGGFGFH